MYREFARLREVAFDNAVLVQPAVHDLGCRLLCLLAGWSTLRMAPENWGNEFRPGEGAAGNSGYRAADWGRLFENAVYLQLVYGGRYVHVGKLYGKEVDFVAVKDGRTVCLQVADEMLGGARGSVRASGCQPAGEGWGIPHPPTLPAIRRCDGP